MAGSASALSQLQSTPGVEEAFVVQPHASSHALAVEAGKGVPLGKLSASTGGSDADKKSDSTAVQHELDDVLGSNLTKRPVPKSWAGKALYVGKGFVSEGHTAWDSFLSSASAQVGQVILTLPYQMALMSVPVALTVGIGVGFLNFFTLWLLVVLFLERKRYMVQQGTWYDTQDSHCYLRRKAVTQYHDVIRFAFGGNWWLGLFAEILTAIYILGVAIAQIIASAGSQYAINKNYNKFEWGLILGGILLVFGFLPSFRSVRVLNIVALVGTNFSCLYFFIYAASHGIRPGVFARGPVSAQGFFLGAAVIGAGGHSIQMEVMDAMRQSRKMSIASFMALIWNFLLLYPHSAAIVLAFPTEIAAQANVYSILPNSNWKSASVYMMLIHNISAFTLHTVPLLWMWEKLIHTHHLAWYIRLPSRAPVLALIWLISLALPFYGTMNSLFNAFTTSFTAFILPCAAFMWHYRTQAARDNCPVKVHRILAYRKWAPLKILNIVLILVFLAQFGGGVTYSVKQLVANVHTFKWFATCYQCPKAVVHTVHAPAHAPSPYHTLL